MKQDFKPQLHPIPISELRPTQMTIGFREVARKRHDWDKRSDKDKPCFLGSHMIPVVIGPKDRPYLIDHHHLARALHEEGIEHVLASVVADLSHLKLDMFRTFMDNRNWLHPFDHHGVRHSYDDIPKTIRKLADDPYRSLAGALRRAGGYAKSSTPYTEFLWADFLRRRIGAHRLAEQFEDCLNKALALAHSKEASYLPGWAGADG